MNKNQSTKEKSCVFYVSDYHFEMISLPYISKKLEEEKKVIILTENNLENLNENHREIIVLKLWELLEKVTERYTMGDSSSVPEEVVEELLRSICFLLKRELGDLKTSVVLLENGDLEKILKFAWVNIEKDIAKGKNY